jgi:hypothetical protein
VKAQQLLDRTASGLGDPTAKAMQQAFDEAWKLIAQQWRNDPKATQDNRLKLAECIVTVTHDGATDAEQIKLLALQMLQIIRRA